MLLQKLHPGLRTGQQLVIAGSDTPLFSRQGHRDCGVALHCVAMALALLGRLADPVDIRRDTGPEASFWDRAWPHYLHGPTLPELASFVWELNLGVRPVAAQQPGHGTALLRTWTGSETAGDDRLAQSHASGSRHAGDRNRQAAAQAGVHTSRAPLLSPPEAGPGFAACNARAEFEAKCPSYVTAAATYPVAIEGAVSIRPARSPPYLS